MYSSVNEAENKKYNLELDHIENMRVYFNNDYEFSAALTDEVKNKYNEMWEMKDVTN